MSCNSVTPGAKPELDHIRRRSTSGGHCTYPIDSSAVNSRCCVEECDPEADQGQDGDSHLMGFERNEVAYIDRLRVHAGARSSGCPHTSEHKRRRATADLRLEVDVDSPASQSHCLASIASQGESRLCSRQGGVSRRVRLGLSWRLVGLLTTFGPWAVSLEQPRFPTAARFKLVTIRTAKTLTADLNPLAWIDH